jgi:hypothetical protein
MTTLNLNEETGTFTIEGASAPEVVAIATAVIEYVNNNDNFVAQVLRSAVVDTLTPDNEAMATALIVTGIAEAATRAAFAGDADVEEDTAGSDTADTEPGESQYSVKVVG